MISSFLALQHLLLPWSYTCGPRLQLVDVSPENLLVFEHISLHFQYRQWYVWLPIFLDSWYLLSSWQRILIFLIQITLSGIWQQAAWAVPFHLPVPICLPVCGPRYFSGIEPGNGQWQAFGRLAHLWPASICADWSWHWRFHWSHWGPVFFATAQTLTPYCVHWLCFYADGTVFEHCVKKCSMFGKLFNVTCHSFNIPSLPSNLEKRYNKFCCKSIEIKLTKNNIASGRSEIRDK